jgi:hypothetical protein
MFIESVGRRQFAAGNQAEWLSRVNWRTDRVAESSDKGKRHVIHTVSNHMQI